MIVSKSDKSVVIAMTEAEFTQLCDVVGSGHIQPARWWYKMLATHVPDLKENADALPWEWNRSR